MPLEDEQLVRLAQLCAGRRPQLGVREVVGAVMRVYFSTFADRTYALDARTGKLLWTWPDGEYSPVVTDGRRLYLTGRGRLYALVRVVPRRK
jgi:outer membrane protein assembly factor BamB